MGGGGGTSAGFSYGASLLDSRLFLQVQAYALFGAGLYGGLGISGGGGPGAVPLGINTTQSIHWEVDVGTPPAPIGVSVGGEIVADADGFGFGGLGGFHESLPGGRLGFGTGLFAGAGPSTTSTIAAPTLREIWNKIASHLDLPQSRAATCTN